MTPPAPHEDPDIEQEGQDDEDDGDLTCLGNVQAMIVGLRYYDGTVSDMEMVKLVREPSNPHDSNAIRVSNIRGEQVGHIERYKACHLAPLVDQGLARIEGAVLRASGSIYKMPCSIFVFCKRDLTVMEAVRQRLRYGDMCLRDDTASSKCSPGRALPVAASQPGGSPDLARTPLRLGAHVRSPNTGSTILVSSQPVPVEPVQDIGSIFETLVEGVGARQMMEPAESIKSTLFSHQKEALAWMVTRENSLKLPPFWEAKRSRGSAQTTYTNTLTNFSTNQRPSPLWGGLLADDMGLGKTLALISLIATNKPGAVLPPVVDVVNEASAEAPSERGPPKKRRKTTQGPPSQRRPQASVPDTVDADPSFQPPLPSGPKSTLIVCPLSVLSNWTSQLQEHAVEGSLSLYIYHGPDRRKDAGYLRQFDIVLTTYNVLAAEGTEAKPTAPLQQGQWLRVILDEAHYIKALTTRQTKAAIALRAQRRWAVTGTPIQNKVADLHSLVAFLGLQPLQDKSFWLRTIQRPLRMQDAQGFSRLRALVASIALRRTKDMQGNGRLLVELPPKTVSLQVVEFAPEERALYDRLELEGQRIVNGLMAEGTMLQNYASIMEIILRLRQICDHASLCPVQSFGLSQKEGGDAAPASPELLGKLLAVLQAGGEDECPICLSPPALPVVTRCAHVFCRRCMEAALVRDQRCPMCRGSVKAEDLIEGPQEDGGEAVAGGEKKPSAKVTALLQSLREVQANDPSVKSVVFSQFTTMLNLVQAELRRDGLQFVRLDGSMSSRQREEALRAFQAEGPESPRVFLVSLKAAGVGLNLTAASRVYLLDPWWNPAVEEQAMDRVHRLGQIRPVQVIRFVVANSIEERILELQERKRELASSAFQRRTREQEIQKRLEDVKLLMRL